MATPAAEKNFPHVAPVYTADQARELVCPLFSKLNPDNTLTMVKCIAGACSLWDWLIKPVKIPGVPDMDYCGTGKCSIPRRAYTAALRLAQQRGRAGQ